MVLNTQEVVRNGDPIPINYGTIVMNNLRKNLWSSFDSIDFKLEYSSTNYSLVIEDVITSFTNKDFRPINNDNPTNIIAGDTSSASALAYVSGRAEHNSASELQFSPEITSDMVMTA